MTQDDVLHVLRACMKAGTFDFANYDIRLMAIWAILRRMEME